MQVSGYGAEGVYYPGREHTLRDAKIRSVGPGSWFKLDLNMLGAMRV